MVLPQPMRLWRKRRRQRLRRVESKILADHAEFAEHRLEVELALSQLARGQHARDEAEHEAHARAAQRMAGIGAKAS
eukprot:7323600-Heterocapsa_arctica.AAC.1